VTKPKNVTSEAIRWLWSSFDGERRAIERWADRHGVRDELDAAIERERPGQEQRMAAVDDRIKRGGGTSMADFLRGKGGPNRPEDR
jgi:hypothetical protein